VVSWERGCLPQKYTSSKRQSPHSAGMTGASLGQRLGFTIRRKDGSIKRYKWDYHLGPQGGLTPVSQTSGPAKFTPFALVHRERDHYPRLFLRTAWPSRRIRQVRIVASWCHDHLGADIRLATSARPVKIGRVNYRSGITLMTY
jgi:hypothetical protein